MSSFRGFLGCLFFLCACRASVDEAVQETRISAYVTTPVKKDIGIHDHRVAEIVAIRNVEIRNRIAGFLDEVYVDEGEWVKAGTVMFRFNATELKAAYDKELAYLKSTEAEARVAALKVERLKALVEKNIISSLDLQIAKSKKEALEAKVGSIRQVVALAQLQVTYMDVVAPFDGSVNLIPYKAGSFVSTGTLLTTFSDTRKVYAYFHMPETEYLKIFRKNKSEKNRLLQQQQVGLILSDGTRYKYSGIIQMMGAEVESGTGTIMVRALFSNPDLMLKHRASAKVDLPIVLEKALLVPQRSVMDIQDKKYVYLLQPDRKVQMRAITTTYRYLDYFVVDDGLRAQDTLIYEGLQQIKSHTKVQPLLISADSLWKID